MSTQELDQEFKPVKQDQTNGEVLNQILIIVEDIRSTLKKLAILMSKEEMMLCATCRGLPYYETIYQITITQCPRCKGKKWVPKRLNELDGSHFWTDG